jgi:hypothetical protein
MADNSDELSPPDENRYSEPFSRRGLLAAGATAAALGVAGCSQPDDTDGSPSSNETAEPNTTVSGTENDQVTPSETENDSTTTETEGPTSTETENDLPEGVSYPESGEPPTEITLLETSDDYEVVLVDAYKTEKYIGDTMRIPEVGFVDDVEGYLYFSAYQDEEGRSPQEGIAVRPEDTEWTVEDFRENGTGVFYEIEGPLYAVESVGGGNVLVLGGGNVSITEQ